ncbi:unnamed protein product [Ectocarpus sp. CCAP 1310/34]|nr:unnamed protein product [Ectocarpus sp. CCAP 1310/34]
MAFARLKNIALGGLLLQHLPVIVGQGPPGEETSSVSSGLPPLDMSSPTSGDVLFHRSPLRKGDKKVMCHLPAASHCLGKKNPLRAGERVLRRQPAATPDPALLHRTSLIRTGEKVVRRLPAETLTPVLLHRTSLLGTGEKVVFTNTSCANRVNYGVDKGLDLHVPVRIYAVNQSTPAYPQLFADGYSTDLSETIGLIGILVDGVPMCSAFAGTPVTDWDSTAMAAEYNTFDACASHSTTEGHYHTHGTPGCFMEQGRDV